MKFRFVKRKEAATLGQWNIWVRNEGQALAPELSIFQEAWAKQTDAKGSLLLTAAEKGEVRFLLVLTIARDIKPREIQKAVFGLRNELELCKLQDLAVLLDAELCRTRTIQLAKSFLLLGNHFASCRNSGFSRQLEAEPDKTYAPQSLLLAIPFAETEALAHEAESLALAVRETRELVNLPANRMTPTRLGEEARRLGQENGFTVEVRGRKEIEELGMQAFLAVAQGSEEEPQLIVMRYLHAPDSQERLALVGKGLCYDSGGYDLKNGNGMAEMHTDMGGAAGVIGAMCAIAREALPVNVVGIVAACENMVSGHAYRNGDIIGSMAAKTIEVKSTDAEGRLTLADAVTYAWQKEGASCIWDMATLTGAVGIALGHYAGVLTDDDKLYAIAEKAGRKSGDPVWRLPVDEEFEAYNKSWRADISNIGGRAGGAITAGLFVRAFTGKVPFMHFDIAAITYKPDGTDRTPKGATGAGAELFYYGAREFFGAGPVCPHHP